MQRARLDRFISSQLGINKREVRMILAQARVKVDGVLAKDIGQIVDKFSHVMFDDQVLQQESPRYLMMHKPIGVISATKDQQHQTVMDLLGAETRADLHIAGRLDLNSSGLLLLTNDSSWSQRLTAPEKKVTKRYLVELAKPLTQEMVAAFAKGMYFAFEDITTRGAELEIVQPCLARVSLVEGRYHQIKRMFGRFRNPVLKLHRYAVGNLQLDPELMPGQTRPLTAQEVAHIDNDSETAS
jgi:16S rRNA pseudouridine516 synthase